MAPAKKGSKAAAGATGKKVSPSRDRDPSAEDEEPYLSKAEQRKANQKKAREAAKALKAQEKLQN